MPELRAVRDVKHTETSGDLRDLEAETARKIHMLVLRAKVWAPNVVDSNPGIEAAAL